jgi:type III pantothenate kinase
MQTLLVDIGNTRTKWRAVDVAAGFAKGDPGGAAPLGEHAALARDWRDQKPASVWIANVAKPEELAALRAVLEDEHPSAQVFVLVPKQQEAGVINCYPEPARLGADRWAALIGARALYPGRNVLLTSLGTATTIDVLRDDGHFAGGVILPGIALMRHALAHNTAGLPLAQGRYRALAQGTDDAIDSGILHAQAGAIERVLRDTGLMAGDSGPGGGVAGEAVCLLTGGDAALVLPLLPFSAVIADNLVLRGLLVVAREGHSSRVET